MSFYTTIVKKQHKLRQIKDEISSIKTQLTSAKTRAKKDKAQKRLDHLKDEYNRTRWIKKWQWGASVASLLVLTLIYSLTKEENKNDPPATFPANINIGMDVQNSPFLGMKKYLEANQKYILTKTADFSQAAWTAVKNGWSPELLEKINVLVVEGMKEYIGRPEIPLFMPHLVIDISPAGYDPSSGKGMENSVFHAAGDAERERGKPLRHAIQIKITLPFGYYSNEKSLEIILKHEIIHAKLRYFRPYSKGTYYDTGDTSIYDREKTIENEVRFLIEKGKEFDPDIKSKAQKLLSLYPGIKKNLEEAANWAFFDTENPLHKLTIKENFQQTYKMLLDLLPPGYFPTLDSMVIYYFLTNKFGVLLEPLDTYYRNLTPEKKRISIKF